MVIFSITIREPLISGSRMVIGQLPYVSHSQSGSRMVIGTITIREPLISGSRMVIGQLPYVSHCQNGSRMVIGTITIREPLSKWLTYGNWYIYHT